MHKLSASFILGYHGCDEVVAKRLLRHQAFKPSRNDYDWLGEGVYFWEANPLRGLEFAIEASKRKSSIKKPAVVGSIIDLGYCLDLTTSLGLQRVTIAHDSLAQVLKSEGHALPINSPDGFRHNLDCAVINYLHRLVDQEGEQKFDSVKGIFIEPPPLYPGSAFGQKNHIQIAVRNPDCIKGVFRVPPSQLQ